MRLMPPQFWTPTAVYFCCHKTYKSLEPLNHNWASSLKAGGSKVPGLRGFLKTKGGWPSTRVVLGFIPQKNIKFRASEKHFPDTWIKVWTGVKCICGSLPSVLKGVSEVACVIVTADHSYDKKHESSVCCFMRQTPVSSHHEAKALFRWLQ